LNTDKGHIKIETFKLESLNNTVGTAKCQDFVDMSEEDIKELFNLDNEGHKVTHVYKFARRVGEKFTPTDRVKVTVNSPKLPTELKFMYQKVELKKITPTPIRCRRCQILGHSKGRCDKMTRCHRCST
jgi:hypothetical protein